MPRVQAWEGVSVGTPGGEGQGSSSWKLVWGRRGELGASGSYLFRRERFFWICLKIGMEGDGAGFCPAESAPVCRCS